MFEGPITPDLEWPTWIVLQRHSAGLLPDVFPFPAGDLGFLENRRAPYHDHGHVDGLEERAHVEANPSNMDDNLHTHDLQHKPIGHEGKKGGQQ